jgi:hypothetical protein
MYVYHYISLDLWRRPAYPARSAPDLQVQLVVEIRRDSERIFRSPTTKNNNRHRDSTLPHEIQPKINIRPTQSSKRVQKGRKSGRSDLIFHGSLVRSSLEWSLTPKSPSSTTQTSFSGWWRPSRAAGG